MTERELLRDKIREQREQISWTCRRLHRPDDKPETETINDDGIDYTLHCCDWNEVYEICCIADGAANPRHEREKEIDAMRAAVKG